MVFCGLGHGVHGERRGERIDIESVGSGRILGARTRPEQALDAGARIGQPVKPVGSKPFQVSFVSAFGDRNAEAVQQRARDLVLDRDVPAADEKRGDGSDRRIEAGFDAPLDAAQIGIRRRNILLGGKEQRHVDGTPAKVAASMAGRPSGVPGTLMKRFGLPARRLRSRAAVTVRSVS